MTKFQNHIFFKCFLMLQIFKTFRSVHTFVKKKKIFPFDFPGFKTFLDRRIVIKKVLSHCYANLLESDRTLIIALGWYFSFRPFLAAKRIKVSYYIY